jgi:hypothetical protein
MDLRQERGTVSVSQYRTIARHDPVGDAALDALDRRKAAVMRDVGRLGRPRRDRPGTGNDQTKLAAVGVLRAVRAVGENALERVALGSA